MFFFNLLLSYNVEQSGEWPVPASRQQRMVARPGNDQLHMRLA
jgi:hypothetical protein